MALVFDAFCNEPSILKAMYCALIAYSFQLLLPATPLLQLLPPVTPSTPGNQAAGGHSEAQDHRSALCAPMVQGLFATLRHGGVFSSRSPRLGWIRPIQERFFETRT